MTTARFAAGCFALTVALSACSGYRSGPPIYSRVSVESPWQAGSRDVAAGDATDPTLQGELPSMGMPDATGFGYDDF